MLENVLVRALDIKFLVDSIGCEKKLFEYPDVKFPDDVLWDRPLVGEYWDIPLVLG